jgi:cellulose synthase/poly-beta-1,6-N-acetylglucosamine synthase-like glycosyltransferase
MNGLILVTVILYGLVLSVLFIYGLNFFYHSYLTHKHRGPDPEPFPMDHHPKVTVQIPIYNERYVARRVIDAIAALAWPRDRLQIQVLDDSDDDTVAIVAETVRRHQNKAMDIQHLHRTNRIGYKAGALSEGMRHATGEFIAIFDADFYPEPDFLHRTLPHFNKPDVGFVQTRWGHLNERYSFFTELQALAIDGHFMVEQFARSREGFLLNFNGTAGVWRAATIEDAGGWEFDTLTEDLDLSYRAQLAGWKGVYLRDTVTPGELPVTVNGFRRQQYRWARGSTETARKLLPRVLKSNLDLRLKVQSILHMTGYGIHGLMFAMALMYPLIALLSQGRPFVVTLYGLAAIFNLTALAPTTYFTMGQHEKSPDLATSPIDPVPERGRLRDDGKQYARDHRCLHQARCGFRAHSEIWLCWGTDHRKVADISGQSECSNSTRSDDVALQPEHLPAGIEPQSLFHPLLCEHLFGWIALSPRDDGLGALENSAGKTKNPGSVHLRGRLRGVIWHKTRSP